MSLFHTLIKASAGAGKTFQLSNRYLRLIFQGVPPETILATTFTRKAAGEILDRILQRLAEAALDDKKRSELSKYVKIPDSKSLNVIDSKSLNVSDSKSLNISDSKPLNGSDIKSLNGSNDFNKNSQENKHTQKTLFQTDLFQEEILQNEFLQSEILQNELSQEDVLATLAKLVRSIHRLRVSTLDSFFQQIAGNLGLELGLPPAWMILEEDDTSPLLLEGIRRLLEQLGKEKAVELMYLLFKGESRSRVTQEIQSLLADLKMIYDESLPQAWRQLERAKELSADEIQRLTFSLAQAEIAQTKKKEPNQMMLKARNKDLDAIRAALENNQKIAWEEIGGQGLCQKVLDGSYIYSRAEMPDSLCAVYDEIVRQVRAVVINRLATQTEAMAELLEELTKRVDALKYQERLFDFSDITYRLARASIDGLYQQISHRIDAHTHHLLLDEFQDTSPSQWFVLRPFAKRIVQSQTPHGSTSFFCVGDVKQAIYGWRGGVAAIFDTVEKDLGELNEEHLDKSFRSCQSVIDTVNEVFENIGTNAALLGDSNDPKKQQDAQPLINAAEIWAKRFAKHQTQRTSLDGYCSLLTSKFPPEEIDENGEVIKPSSDERKHAHLKFVIDEILERHKNAPTATIGVLTRTNEMVRRIIHGLREKNVEASEEGGNPLDQSPAVELILSALSLADYPGNKVARFHLANSVLAEKLGVTLKNYRSESAMQFASLQIRRRLAIEGYTAVLYDWTETLAPICDDRDLQRLVQLLELASTYQRKAKIRTSPFIELVRTKKVESPSASPIRVMSIHKSKGLQFDIVILPELDAKLTGTITPKVISGRDDPAGSLTTVLAYPSKESLSYLPERFQTLKQTNESERVEEALCVLYVAMTRAIHELLMIVMPKENSASQKKKNDDESNADNIKFDKTLVGVLHASLAPNESLATENTVLYQHGNRNWLKEKFGEPSGETSSTETPMMEENLTIQLAESPKNFMKNLKHETPSGVEGTDSEMLESEFVEEILPIDFKQMDFKQSETKTFPKKQTKKDEQKQHDKNLGKLYGTAIHACFEQVQWLDQQMPSREQLTKIVQNIVQDQLDAAEIIEKFYRYCGQTEIREALSFAAYQQPRGAVTNPHLRSAVHCPKDVSDISCLRWEVQSERQFWVLSKPDTLLQGSMDRLTLLYDTSNNQRRVIGADVIDFKSDRVTTDEELAAKIQFYQPQLSEYQTAAAMMFHLSKQQITTRLMFVSLNRVVKL